MALSERSRSALYQAFSRTIEEEAVAEMLAHFPARDVEEPVTREHLDRRMAELRAELHAEIAGVRTEIADLRGELHAEIAGVRTEMADLRGELHADMSGLRGELHTEIAGVREAIAATANRTLVWLFAAMVAVAGVTASLSARLGG